VEAWLHGEVPSDDNVAVARMNASEDDKNTCDLHTESKQPFGPVKVSDVITNQTHPRKKLRVHNPHGQ